MRISCQTVEDFLKNIEGETVYQDTVFVEKTRTSMNGSSPRDATSFQVYFRIGCVLEYADSGQSMIDCVEDCGIDRHTCDGDLSASERCESLRMKVEEVCQKSGLRVRPGMLDV